MRNLLHKFRLMLLGIFIALSVGVLAQITGGGISAPPPSTTPTFDTLTVTGISDLQGDVSDSLGSFTVADTMLVTGTATFNNKINTGNNLTITFSAPTVNLVETGVTTDNSRWRMTADAEQLMLQATNDAQTVNTNLITVDRTGTTVDTINLAATTVTQTANAVVTGTSDLQGDVSDSLGDFTIADAVIITGSLATGNVITASGSGAAQLKLVDTVAPVDEKRWVMRSAGGQLQFQAFTDADAFGANAILINRTGTTIDTVNLLATALQHNGLDLTVDEGTWTVTTTGCASEDSGTVHYVRIGNMVTMNFPSLSCTSDATTKTLTGLPTALQIVNVAGTYAARVMTNGIDNSVQYIGVCTVFEASSVLTCTPGVIGAAWVNSGNFSINAFNLNYILQ